MPKKYHPGRQSQQAKCRNRHNSYCVYADKALSRLERCLLGGQKEPL